MLKPSRHPSTLLHPTLPYSAPLYSNTPYSLASSAPLHSTPPYSTLLYYALFYSTLLYSTLPNSARFRTTLPYTPHPEPFPALLYYDTPF